MMQKHVVWMWQLSHAGRLTFIWFLELVSVTFQCLAGPRQGHGFSVRNHTSRVYTTCKLRNQQESNFTKSFFAKTLVTIKKTLVLQLIARFCLRKLHRRRNGEGAAFCKARHNHKQNLFFFCLLRFLRSIAPPPLHTFNLLPTPLN